jgi:hypothetical protein
MCLLHKYQYIGYVMVTRWLGGVAGGIPYEHLEEAKKCKKCGKIKVIE